MLQRFRENWVRPALFFGNNPISLAGGAITSAAGVTMIGYWLVELFGRPDDNPYLGIIFFLILPALFVLGLVAYPDRRVCPSQKAATGRTNSSRISQDRSQRSNVPSRPRHRSRRHDRQPAGGVDGELSRRCLHGLAAVLRIVLPRDASRVHRLQSFRALPR